jgi:hypothetical protein
VMAAITLVLKWVYGRVNGVAPGLGVRERPGRVN